MSSYPGYQKNIIGLALGAFFGFLAVGTQVSLASPLISETAVLMSTSSAQVSWTAADTKPIISAELIYGLDVSYLMTSSLRAAPANVSGTKYFFASKIKNISQGTKIYYKINVVSQGGEKTSFADSFVLPLPDAVPPMVSGIKEAAQNDNATISWSTNEETTGLVEYWAAGESPQSRKSANFNTEHHLYLGDLKPLTSYQYRIISTDHSGNKSTSAERKFSTAGTDSAPLKAGNFTAIKIGMGARLTWKNPLDDNFDRVKIVKSEGQGKTSPDEGEFVYEGKDEKFYDTRVVADKEYYYTIFSLNKFDVPSEGVVSKLTEEIFPKIYSASSTAKDLSQTKEVPSSTTESSGAMKQISETAAVIKDLAGNKEIQETVNTVVAPTAVGVAAVSAISVLSWVNLLPFIQLIFQTLLFFGGKKHTATGIVYNALNKMPVDLATVRLFNRENGLVVQSKVTDKEGRYVFVINPGLYRVEVLKNGYTFPTQILRDFRDDGKKANIYHGETIETSASNAVIAANIPIDPVGDYDQPLMKLWWQKTISILQDYLIWIGLVIIIISLLLSPKWYTALLLVVQVFIIVARKRIASRPNVKSWGVVTDASTGRQIGQVIVRLFNADLNKLVASQVTDSRGRYYFLAGDGKYYLTFNNPRYEIKKSTEFKVDGKKAETISLDITLTPKASS